MRNYLPKFFLFLVILAVYSLSAFGQNTSTGSLSGTVVDPHGAVVAGATVTVKSVATNKEFTTQTSGEGTFTVPALMDGVYSATIVAAGFKQAVVTDIKITVSTPSSINVALEIGAGTETVTVVGGGELVQTQTATVGTSITGRQITELPYASRNALDLLLFLPGTSTAGRPRASTINGLPKSMLNITLDGLNIQDNLLKGSDGFFTIIQPKTDAVQEVSVSTSTPGAESNSEGAVQIKFTTRSGSNDYHGSLYEEHRDKSLNTNFFWNNELLAPKPHFGAAASPSDRAPRTNQLLNQPGGRIGGPIRIPHLFNGKDKAFFFINYEEYRLPEATLRSRLVLSPGAIAGNFTYGTTTVNLFTLAAANGFTSTPDPTIAALMTSIRAAQGGFSNTSDPNVQNLSFINSGGQKRQFPTARFDFELNKKNHIDTEYNYQVFRSKVDFLNNADPFAPGFPNHGAQNSNRYSSTTAWRTTIKQNLVNEARFGVQNSMVVFFPEVNAGQFTNQGGFSLDIRPAASGISQVTTVNAPQRRNTPTNQFSDNLSWVKGKHTLNFGGDMTSVSTFLQNGTNSVVPTISFAQDTSDTVENMFVVANFPGSSAAQRAQADTLYRVLTGRMNNISHAAGLNEAGSAYIVDGDIFRRYRERELGFYGQDSWRFRSNLTLNFGLRLDVQYAPISQNKALSQNTFAGLFGTSGSDLSALFKPGATAGSPTQFTALPPGQHLYNTAHNLAPTFGFAYQPNFKHGLMKRLTGNAGQTVLRGGWSMAFDREGLNLTDSIIGFNFGGSLGLSQFAGTDFARGTLFRNIPVGPATPPPPVFPLTPGPFDQAIGNAFLPNLKSPYVESFSGSIQREITKDTVVEIGYVGNRGHQLLRQFNLNDANTIENGFASEFKLAQKNLAANALAGRCQQTSPTNTTPITTANCQFNFGYFGPGTGTFPLPIFLANFSAQTAANAGNLALYTSSQFRSTTFVNRLAPTNAQVIGIAGILANPFNGFTGNAITAGLPANFFIVNPQLPVFTGNLGTSGAFLVTNDGKVSYDALQIDVRHRMSRGVLFDFNYTYARALTNEYVSSSTAFAQPATWRNTFLNKTFSPFDIRQSLKGSFIAEMPVGRGRRFLGNSHGIMEGLLGNWALNGTLRVSSGVPINLGNVQVVGMTNDDLQKAIQIRKVSIPNPASPTGVTGQVFWLPQDIITNTILAFSTTGQSLTGYGSGGAPTGRYLAPAGANCVQAFTGQCATPTLILHGPRFTRLDLGISKKVKFSETKNIELRFEFLNALNNIDFRLGSFQADVYTIGGSNSGTVAVPTFTSAAFGQLTGPESAYRDTSTTNDPGGRVGQIVIRFNF